MNIYAVWVNIAARNEIEVRNNRYVILAETAQEAEEVALNAQWPTMTENGRRDARWRVMAGLLGTYEPGITGDHMTQDVLVAIERWDERIARSQENLERDAFIQKSHNRDTEGQGDRWRW